MPGYTDVFSKALVSLGEKNKTDSYYCSHAGWNRTCGILQEISGQIFDVGIAEEHAVSFAAGLALGGLVPVVAIYSSFLQRAVDQILHDVCMQKLHVILLLTGQGL